MVNDLFDRFRSPFLTAPQVGPDIQGAPTPLPALSNDSTGAQGRPRMADTFGQLGSALGGFMNQRHLGGQINKLAGQSNRAPLPVPQINPNEVPLPMRKPIPFQTLGSPLE